MRGKISLLLIGCLFLSLLCGCENASSHAMMYIDTEDSDADKVEIELNFFGFKVGSHNLEAIENAMQSYMSRRSSVRVSYEGLKSSEYWEVLDLRNENNNLDDIFMVDHDAVISMKKDGKLANLADLSTISNFSDMAVSQFTESDGSVYFLPTQISTFNLYINEELLAEYGFDIPTSWSEFASICDYFVACGTAPIVGNNFTTIRALIAAKSLYPVYQMDNPAELIEKFNSGEVDIMDYLSNGIEMVGEMLDRGWFDAAEVLNTEPTSDDLALFASGDRPFMITGGWASQSLMDLKPAFSYGIYPFPILEDGSVLVMNVDTCISVSAKSTNSYIGKNFVEYLTSPEIIVEYCNSQSSFAPINEDWSPTDSALEPTVPYLLNGQSVIGSDYRLELPLDNASTEIGLLMLGGMSTKDAIAKMNELIHE